MHIMALRLRDDRNPSVGISLHYYHRDLPPSKPGELLKNPGTLKKVVHELPNPAGDLVLSNFDLFAPDDADAHEIIADFEAFRQDLFSNPLPWHGPSGRCYFEFDCVFGLYGAAPHEMKELFRRALGFKKEFQHAREET